MVEPGARPDIPEQPDEFTCPDCGDIRSSKGLSLHWAHPGSDCEYPRPSTYERNLLIGLWLSGASVNQQGTHPVLRKTTSRRYMLDWIQHELGIWGIDVSLGFEASAQRSAVETEFGADSPSSSDRYRLTCRACPFLHELLGEPIDSVTLSPVSARVLYSFKGHLIGHSAVAMRHEDGPGLVRLLHESGFRETSLYEPEKGKNQDRIVLSAECSRDFAEWIGGDPIPGSSSSKRLEFADSGSWQGQKPTRRVPPEEPSRRPNSAAQKTISLEPDWAWLCACLTQLDKPELAASASDKSLTTEQVYGTVLSLIHRNRHLLPTPSEVNT